MTLGDAANEPWHSDRWFTSPWNFDIAGKVLSGKQTTPAVSR